MLGPLRQNEKYHQFADQRCLCGCVPNYMDVYSNAAFLLVAAQRLATQIDLLGVGVLLTSFGSAYYHWKPTTQRLFWDRLPMTIGFAQPIATSTHIHPLFILFLGLVSVCYWKHTNDLRLYVLYQYGGVLCCVCAFPYAVAIYALAKLCEHMDRPIFVMTGETISGHTLKHVVAACAIRCID